MKRHLGLIAVLVVIFVAGVGFFNDVPEKLAVIEQTDQLVSQHKLTKFKNVAVNAKTVRYLEALPEKARVSDLSDAQGGNSDMSYYVAQLGDRTAGVVVEKQMPFVWKVKTVSVW
ncbi:hypothetical protein [Secundilactobacillus collinoides]|nr:hypothetical protein [Secundilactobacillus collinoides]KZL43099.1 hypothetical protein TY91_02025 [Secundilactobacillus collinoides]